MGHGLRATDGLRAMVGHCVWAKGCYGLLAMGYGPWAMGCGLWGVGAGSRAMGYGLRTGYGLGALLSYHSDLERKILPRHCLAPPRVQKPIIAKIKDSHATVGAMGLAKFKIRKGTQKQKCTHTPVGRLPD